MATLALLPAFASKHCTTLHRTAEERIGASKGGTGECPSAYPDFSPVPLMSPHLRWSLASTVSLDHFSSCPNRAGNSGLTSCKRTVTKLKIETCPLTGPRAAQAPSAGQAVSAQPGRAGFWAAGAAEPPRGSCFPHQARPAFLDPEAPRVLSLPPPPPPCQRLLTVPQRKQAWGGHGAGWGETGVRWWAALLAQRAL